jgi:hypothetical protein
VEHSTTSKITQSYSSEKLLWLGAASVASIGLYTLLALRYPLGPSLADPRASWASMVGATGSNAAIHLAIYLGLLLLYLLVLRLLLSSQEENTTFHRRQIILILIIWSICSMVLMFVAPAGESHDIFDYIFRGRMMTEYQANPLADVPAEFNLSAPYVRYIAWRKHVDTYGPLWEMASAAVSGSVRQVAQWLGWWNEAQPVCPRSPESCRLLMLYITGYRMLAISLTGISGWLIASMISRVQAPMAPLALAVWLLNPLTLIASAVGAHNDAMMLVLVVLSWWHLQRQYPLLAIIVLILAAHVKLTALIWLPACAIWIVWRWGWRRALQIGFVGAATSLVLSWLLYAPFDGWQTLPRMLQERSAFLANSPWRILKYLLINQQDWSTKSAHQLSVGLPSLLFVVSALMTPLQLFGFRLKHWSGPLAGDEGKIDSKLWRVLTAVSMSYLLVGSFWFQHWYILWALVPAALLPDHQFTRSVLPWLTFGALFSNVAMDFLLATVMNTSPTLVKSILAVAIIWGPMLLSAAVLALNKRTSKKDSLAQALSY